MKHLCSEDKKKRQPASLKRPYHKQFQLLCPIFDKQKNVSLKKKNCGAWRKQAPLNGHSYQ